MYLTPRAAMNELRRVLLFPAILCIAFCLSARSAAGGDFPPLDEDLVRQAMRHEAFRLLALKIAGDPNGTTAGFDYHIEQHPGCAFCEAAMT